jgi:hypothetical protein
VRTAELTRASTPFLGRLGRAVVVREILGAATPNWARLLITELSALEKT